MNNALAFQKDLELAPPSVDDKRADLERLLNALGMDNLQVPLGLVRELPAALRDNGFNISPLFGMFDGGTRLISLNRKEFAGLAIDIGTTNIAASLHDLKRGTKISAMSIENPQREYGPDILSRVQFAMEHGVKDLTGSLAGGLNRLIEEITSGGAVERKHVVAVTVASNTVMTHFLLGLDVNNIPIEPYTPVVHSPGFFTAGELGLDINPRGVIYIFPNAGSYVGGDIVSGIISTKIHRSGAISVLIDVGTNAEIVIGNRDWLLVGAGAAGPALEEGIFSSGKRAVEGSIYRIDLRGDPAVPVYSTINNAPPAGICGSGIIDLVAGLYEHGMIDSRGRFTPECRTGIINGERAYTLFKDDKTHLYITEREIDNFLRSKAAMFTSLHVLLQAVGIGIGDIERIFIAGALGGGVRVEKAITLGMLPDIPVEKYIPAGNTSIKGAKLLLKDAGLLNDIQEVRSEITYHEMNTDTTFMKEFPGALFIPHANPRVLKP
ncbi:hypothetical protein BMS3Bbin06_01203 [bacterium BMS3Bbin06]|nr:hypothetical protein BMS3Abin08_00926 [bacterium BMS3Abin08]GBE34674.1 hypothetical protein BMS3Bbin06_01203 [bacterium BMS3Bbin06]